MIESATELAGQMTKKVEASTTSNGTTACHKDTSIDGIPSLNTDEFALLSRSLDKRPLGYRVVKRIFDIVFSILVIAACIVLLPLTLLLLIVIAVQTKASPIYVQERVGRYGKPMKIFKLRSMVGDSDNVEKYLNDDQLVQWRKERKVTDDSRVVPVGRFIRKTSIDEFANVINVLAGEMSVIGPRPISYEEMRSLPRSGQNFCLYQGELQGFGRQLQETRRLLSQVSVKRSSSNMSKLPHSRLIGVFSRGLSGQCSQERASE